MSFTLCSIQLYPHNQYLPSFYPAFIYFIILPHTMNYKQKKTIINRLTNIKFKICALLGRRNLREAELMRNRDFLPRPILGGILRNKEKGRLFKYISVFRGKLDRYEVLRHLGCILSDP